MNRCRSRVRQWCVGTLVAATLSLAAAPASAQASGGGLFAFLAVAPYTSAGIGVTTLGGAITGVVLTVNSADDESKASYIFDNATALKQDLTLGHGAAVRDLAEVFQVEPSDYGAFADMVHERRDKLVPLTDREKLTEQRASMFFRTIAKGMREHPRLRDDLVTLGGGTFVER